MQVALPGCLQQFINHNGLLHKVYVMGDQVRALTTVHIASRSGGVM